MLKHIILFAMLIIWSVTASSQINLAINPNYQSINLGNQAIFNIDISGLGNGTALGVYDLTINFDSTVLVYANTNFGSQLNLSGLGDIQSVTPNTDNVEVFELSLDSVSLLNTNQVSSFTLATLFFDTLLTASNSPLLLSVNALGNAYGDSLSANIQSSSVTITTTAVPEPEPFLLWLFGFVLGASDFLCRRNRLLVKQVIKR